MNYLDPNCDFLQEPPAVLSEQQPGGFIQDWTAPAPQWEPSHSGAASDFASTFFFFFFTFSAQKMHESSMHLCVVSCRKLLRKMSRCHRTWRTRQEKMMSEEEQNSDIVWQKYGLRFGILFFSDGSIQAHQQFRRQLLLHNIHGHTYISIFLRPLMSSVSICCTESCKD